MGRGRGEGCRRHIRDYWRAIARRLRWVGRLVAGRRRRAAARSADDAAPLLLRRSLRTPNVPPVSLHRQACRFAALRWLDLVGDIDGQVETLATHVAVGLNHGLSSRRSGARHWRFYPTRELTGELYARWFQFSHSVRRFRSHDRTWHLRLPWAGRGRIRPIENNQNVDPSECTQRDVEPIAENFLSSGTACASKK